MVVVVVVVSQHCSKLFSIIISSLLMLTICSVKTLTKFVKLVIWLNKEQIIASAFCNATFTVSQGAINVQVNSGPLYITSLDTGKFVEQALLHCETKLDWWHPVLTGGGVQQGLTGK